MIRFNCDYLEGAHPAVLELLQQTNLEQNLGYGEDAYSEQARERIRQLCAAPQAGVHFFTGGTQANMTLIAAALRPHQGVLASDLGHINTHETGAIEVTGHKVLALPHDKGKLTAEQVREYVNAHRCDESFEHIVQPGLVYISHPSELGSLYTRDELSRLYAACRELGLYLYVDGARLAYALGAAGNQLSLPELAQLSDAFYLGGTKCGALFGEAIVISNPTLQADFRYMIKQRGGLLAKGWLLALQFLALLEDDRYRELGAHGDKLAAKLDAACVEYGIPLALPTESNQLFPILPDTALERLKQEFGFAYWQRMDERHSMIRLVTSWATQEEAVERLIAALRDISAGGQEHNM